MSPHTLGRHRTLTSCEVSTITHHYTHSSWSNTSPVSHKPVCHQPHRGSPWHKATSVLINTLEGHSGPLAPHSPWLRRAGVCCPWATAVSTWRRHGLDRLANQRYIHTPHRQSVTTCPRRRPRRPRPWRVSRASRRCWRPQSPRPLHAQSPRSSRCARSAQSLL